MFLRFMKRKQYVPVSVPVVCLPMVQCSPFQPSLHSHFPSLQVPCSVQRGWHTRWSHATPVHPSSQRHAPPMHTPWVPQSTEHTSRRIKKIKGLQLNTVILNWAKEQWELKMKSNSNWHLAPINYMLSAQHAHIPTKTSLPPPLFLLKENNKFHNLHAALTGPKLTSLFSANEFSHTTPFTCFRPGMKI